LISENSFNFFLGEFENGWDHKWLDEVLEGILIGVSSVCHHLVFELSEENNLGITAEAVVLLACDISMNELDLVLGVCVWDMSFKIKRMVLSTEVGNDEFVALVSDLILKGIASDLSGWWSRLLEDPLDNIYKKPQKLNPSSDWSLCLTPLVYIQIHQYFITISLTNLKFNSRSPLSFDNSVLGSSSSVFSFNSVPL